MQESYLIPTVGSNASLWHEHGQPTVVSSSNTQVSTTAGEKIELEGNDDTLIGSGYAIAAQENLTVTLGGAGVSSAAIGFLGSLDTINVAQGSISVSKAITTRSPPRDRSIS